MVPFYLNVCVHLTFMSLMFFLLPESLSSEARVILTKNAQLAKERARRRDQAEREWENETPASEPADPHMPIGGDSGWSRLSHAGHSKRRKRLVGNLTRLLRSARAPLQPLAIFLPRERDDGTKDYNLTAAGCAIFCASMLYVSPIPTSPALTVRVSSKSKRSTRSTPMAGLRHSSDRTCPSSASCAAWCSSC